MQDIKNNLIQDKILLLDKLKEYRSIEAKRQKDKYSCVFCNSSDALSVYATREGINNYKCFSCGEHGNIIDLVMSKHSISFLEAIKKNMTPARGRLHC